MPARTTVRLFGEIDFLTIGRWNRVFDAALRDTPDVIALDMCDVTFIDSAGIGMLVAARARCIAESVQIELGPVSRSVQDLLHMTGLEPAFGARQSSGFASPEAASDGEQPS